MTGTDPARAVGRWVAAADPALVAVTAAGRAADAPVGVDGCLVGFWSQSSIDPPRLAVWLSRVNATYRLAADAPALGVHLLGDTDRALARLLGGSTADDDPAKPRRIGWRRGPLGVPVIGTLAWIVGRVVGTADTGGDHVCFDLEPVAAQGRPPLRPLRLSAVGDLEPGHPA